MLICTFHFLFRWVLRFLVTWHLLRLLITAPMSLVIGNPFLAARGCIARALYIILSIDLAWQASRTAPLLHRLTLSPLSLSPLVRPPITKVDIAPDGFLWCPSAPAVFSMNSQVGALLPLPVACPSAQLFDLFFYPFRCGLNLTSECKSTTIF